MQGGHRRRFRFRADEVDWFQDQHADMLLPAGDGQPYRVQGKFLPGTKKGS